MKNLILPLALFCSTAAALAQETAATVIEVHFSNVSTSTGKVVVALNSEATFMKSTPLKTVTSLIKDGKASVTFTDIPQGVYGIIAFHDENDNDQIDMGPTGIPKEAYGVSNNPMSFGPPQWSEANFEAGSEPVILEIRF